MAEDQAVLDEVVSVRDVENEDHIGFQRRNKDKQEQRRDQRPKRQPRYNVILWDDPDHSYEYVIAMVKELFRKPIEMGYQVAKEVDTTGRAILLTTTREHAELKRDQIHAFGKDQYIERCKGSMSATIEPAE